MRIYLRDWEAVNIGAPKHDISEKGRQLSERYALDSPAGVRKLLRDYYPLIERQYLGDYDATVILIDLAEAIERARLTRRQRQALYYVYVRDLTQEKAAEHMNGVTRQNVADLLAKAEAAIAEQFEAWAWMGEGYEISEETTERVDV